MQQTEHNPMVSLVASMTVAQLGEVVGIGVEDIVDRVFESTTAQPRREAQAPKANGERRAKPQSQTPKNGAKALEAKTWQTRTLAGRQALDKAILAALDGKDNPKRATHIRQAVGGTPAQIRTRLNAMIEDGKVAYSGRASASKYWRA